MIRGEDPGDRPQVLSRAAAALGRGLRSVRRIGASARAGLATLRGQLIVPYVLLTLLTAMVGMFVVTRLVASSLSERFVNQLYQASRVSADGTVRKEESHLAVLRQMAFTQGVPRAFRRHDADGLTEMLWPVALNYEVEAVAAVDRSGIEILGLLRRPGTTEYERTQGSPFGQAAFVERVLAGEADARGDKFVGILETNFGTYLFTAAPVREGDNLVGSLLVGARLDSLAAELKLQALADVVLMDPKGELWSTTMPASAEEAVALLLPPEEAAGLSGTVLREFDLSNRPYQAAYSPWIVRGDVQGILGVVLPSNFLVSTEATSRNLFSALFSVGTVSMIVVGYLLAQSIARPILRLRSMAQAVAAGNLDQHSGLKRPDEIGDLASAFDIMTERLQYRTAEAERLYSEAVERNRQLAEMYQQLQRAQQQLIQSEKLAAVGQLTAGIVHDVKNPLAVIKGMAEELLEEANGRPDVTDAVQVIRDNASRANSIVTDLLKFARQSTPEVTRRDLRETLEGSLRLTGYLLRKGGVRLEQDLPARPVEIVYDAQQIEQVLINLIQNAVQAMPDGGVLRVRLRPTAGGAEFSVSDNGVGIATDVLPRIFDPFFTTKPEGQGTGMGLSVSYGIVSRHGGDIRVNSEPGRGSTFTVQLPEQPPEEVGQKEAVPG